MLEVNRIHGLHLQVLLLLILLQQAARCQRRSSVQFSLGDNTESGVKVGNLFANQPSGPPMSQNFLSAVMKPDEHFKLSTNGDILTSHVIDRDILCNKLECCDRPVCYTHAEAYFFTTKSQPLIFNVTFTLSDENDNSPKFEITQENFVEIPSWLSNEYRALPRLQLSVPESTKANAKIALPLATDPDSIDYGISSYELQSIQGNESLHNNPFRLVHERPRYGAENLNLVAASGLDREVQEDYWFLLTAIGNGVPRLSGNLLLQIKVQDVNDHTPVFTQPPTRSGYRIELPENTAVNRVVFTFRATDKDFGDNGKVTYGINYGACQPRMSASMSKWMLDPETGDLSVAGLLDYENKGDRKFDLSAFAKDGGNPALTASATLTILITDLNDNPPKIEVRSTGDKFDHEKEFDIEENDNEIKLLKLISISDPDSHPEGSVSCSLKDPSGGFSLQKYNSLLYGLFNSRAFDYETDADSEGYLNVRLSCTDNGVPSLTSDLTVRVRLLDRNDNWPQFEHQTFSFSVYEDIPVGSEVGQVIAKDADSGPRGKVTYWLSADDPDDLDYIDIDRETGRLTTKMQLDREEKDILHFRVTAADGGILNSQQEFEEVLRGSKTNTTSVTVRLLDVNDNSPLYVGEKEIHVRENNEEGIAILDSLPFKDDDLGENSTIRLFLTEYGYDAVEYLMPSQSSGIFTLLNDKQLVLTESVDREQNSHFYVRIIAMDGGKARQLTSTTTLTLIVDDENDNYPQLTHPPNATMLSSLSNSYDSVDEHGSRTIPVDTPTGSLITTLRSRDLDDGDNGRISYHLRKAEPNELWFPTQQNPLRHTDIETPLQKHMLISDGYHYFKIDELDGHLKTAWLYGGLKSTTSNSTETLSSPPSLGIHVLVVEMKDAGNPSLATRVVFYVNVSEAVSSGPFSLSGFGFGEAGLGNTIILILIIVCSFALIISLTAAIFWVRFRVYTNNGVPNQVNGVKYQTGCVSVYHDGVPRDPHDGGLGFLDGAGTFKPLEGIRWGSPTMLDPMRYAVHTSTEISVQDGMIYPGKPPSSYHESEEVQMVPVLHPADGEGLLVRGCDQLIVGNGGHYELCFPDSAPANFTKLQGGSTESDSGLDSGGYIVGGHASSPSPEGVTDQNGAPASETSVASTFKPSHSRTYVHSASGCNTINVDWIRQSPGKQLLHGPICHTTDLNGLHKNFGYIPRGSMKPLANPFRCLQK